MLNKTIIKQYFPDKVGMHKRIFLNAIFFLLKVKNMFFKLTTSKL
jgi:hypothetical protein